MIEWALAHPYLTFAGFIVACLTIDDIFSYLKTACSYFKRGS